MVGVAMGFRTAVGVGSVPEPPVTILLEYEAEIINKSDKQEM